jgi:hypothetical protein
VFSYVASVFDELVNAIGPYTQKQFVVDIPCKTVYKVIRMLIVSRELSSSSDWLHILMCREARAARCEIASIGIHAFDV